MGNQGVKKNEPMPVVTQKVAQPIPIQPGRRQSTLCVNKHGSISAPAENKSSEVPPEEPLSKSELDMLKNMFSLFDKDGSGCINTTEVKTVMHSMGYYPSDHWLKQTMLSFDADGNDQIDFEEFTAMFQYLHKESVMNPETALRDALRVLDKNKTGTLNAKHLLQLLSGTGDEPLTEEDINELCNACGRSSTDEVGIDDIMRLLKP